MELSKVQSLLKNACKEDLLEIIVKLSGFSKESDPWLLRYCESLEESSEQQKVQSQVLSHWNSIKYIVDTSNECGDCSDYDTGEIYDALEEIQKLVNNNKTSWSFRKELLDDMMLVIYKKNSGLIDEVRTTCEALCKTKSEELYLADKYRLAGRSYISRAANIFLKNGEDERFIEILSSNLKYETDYIQLANYYLGHGQKDKAVEVMENALTKRSGNNDKIYNWLFDEYSILNQEDKLKKLYKKAESNSYDLENITNKMYEYYSENYNKRKEYLLKMVNVCSFDNVNKWFNECKSVLSKDDFNKESKHLYNILKKKSIRCYLQLRIDEGEYKEVLDYLKAHPSGNYRFNEKIDGDHKLSKQLIPFYPRDIYDLYLMECENLCWVSDRYNYKIAANLLGEIKSIAIKYCFKEIWEQDYTSFWEKHKRKRFLMEYIRENKNLP